MAARGRTRALLVEAADTEFHRRGVLVTTVAEVAEAAGVPAGSVYYHFRTKDDLVAAVVAERTDQVRRDLVRFAAAGGPRERLLAYTRSGGGEQAVDLAAYGCPFAGLVHDLRRAGSELADAAAEPLRLQAAFAAEQLAELGVGVPAEELVARVQGAYLLGHLQGDAATVRRLLASAGEWVASLGCGTSQSTD